MLNIIPVREPIQCGNVSSAIVGDYLLNSTPAAENVFKDEGAESAADLGVKRAPFWLSGERAASLSDVAKVLRFISFSA